MSRAFIGAGTNLGERRENLRRALDELWQIGPVDAVSNVYASDPVGLTDQPRFWNLAAAIQTDLEPRPLLDRLKAAELRIGRTATVRYGPRIVDLDLLLLDDRQFAEPGLRVPHARMLERRFVLQPLLDIDPDLRDPGSGAPLTRFLAASVPPAIERLFAASDLLGTQRPPAPAARNEFPVAREEGESR